MTKFMLILHLCSVVQGACYESTITGFTFKSHYDCAQAGYKIAGATLDELANNDVYYGMERVENEKLAIKFECKELDTKNIIPPKKPKTTT